MGKLLLQSVVVIGFALSSAVPAVAQQPGRSTPKDTNIYSRPAIPGDTAAGPQAVPSGEPTPAASVNVMRVIDVIVNNTDPNLKTTDMIGGRYCAIRSHERPSSALAQTSPDCVPKYSASV